MDDNGTKKDMASLTDLEEGFNKGKFFSFKITNLASSVDKVPCNFVFMDHKG